MNTRRNGQTIGAVQMPKKIKLGFPGARRTTPSMPGESPWEVDTQRRASDVDLKVQVGSYGGKGS